MMLFVCNVSPVVMRVSVSSFRSNPNKAVRQMYILKSSAAYILSVVATSTFKYISQTETHRSLG